MKKYLIASLIGLVLGGAAVGVGYIISGNLDAHLSDCIFMPGIILLIIGLLAMLKGNPTMGLGRMGSGNVTAASAFETRMAYEEAEKTNAAKNHRNNRVFEVNPVGICLMIAALVCILTAVIPSYI